MPAWLEFLLDVVKITIPSLILYFVVREMMKRYFDNQQNNYLFQLKQETQKQSLPLRLQAYERLSLFCERIALPSMLLRLQKERMNVAQLKVSLLMGIQQEFEHNITQQVYVSDQLWQIIKFSKEDAIQVVLQASEGIDAKADSKQLADAILSINGQREMTAADKALVAIKKETSLLFG